MKGRKKTGQNILHYVIASNVVIVFIIAILGGYLFRFYYKKMQEDFYKENSVYIGNIAKRTEMSCKFYRIFQCRLRFPTRQDSF